MWEYLQHSASCLEDYHVLSNMSSLAPFEGVASIWIGVALSVFLGIAASLYVARQSEAMNDIVQAAPARLGTETLNTMQKDLSISARTQQRMIGCGSFASWVLCGILSTFLMSTRPGALFGVLLFAVPLSIMRT